MAGCQKSSGPHVWDNETRPGRALKKFVQQDRSEFRPESYPLGYVEDLNDARTPLADFFSILLTGRPGHVSSAQYMEMQVKHALTTILTGIDDETIPGIGNSLQFANLVTGQHQPPE